tara:strand:+ start:2188 stop:3567 length:1380 start_codon:yes stop_codon:yes gene_type:complete
MSSCNNSSNLSGNLNINNITHSGARLMMTIPLSGFSGGRISGLPGDDGITAGDAIRYNAVAYNETTNPSGGKYVKARSDMSHTSEVVGIVESIDNNGRHSDGTINVNSNVNVVLSGQIKFPEDKLVSATHIYDFTQDDPAYIAGASGGNDIYFLSEVTGGVIQNLAPVEPTTIAKPIFQYAPDGDFTGQVVNYIGYQIGGEIVGTDEDNDPGGSATTVLNFGGGDLDLPPNNFNLSHPNTQFLPVNTGDLRYIAGQSTYYTSAQLLNLGEMGIRVRIELKTNVQVNNIDRLMNTRTERGADKWSGKVVSVSQKTVYLETTNTDIPSAGEFLYGKSGDKYEISDCYTTAVALGKIPATRKKVTNIDGRVINVQQDTIMHINSDASPQAHGSESLGTKGVSVVLPQEVSVNKLTVRKQCVIGSDSENVTATDVGRILNQLKSRTDSSGDKLSISQDDLDIK